MEAGSGMTEAESVESRSAGAGLGMVEVGLVEAGLVDAGSIFRVSANWLSASIPEGPGSSQASCSASRTNYKKNPS